MNPTRPERELDINGFKFQLGESKEKDEELYQLKKIIDKESGHGQWEKQLLNVSLLALLILMNLMLGSSSTKSIIGVESCSAGYWGIFVGFIFICILATIFAI